MIEEILQTIASQNLRVNNLFQLADGTWQANLTDDGKVWEFGRGDGPAFALSNALAATSGAPIPISVPLARSAEDLGL